MKSHRAQYEQASCQMQADDILIAFTDGISEAMSADDEEWGERRLIDAARSFRTLPSIEMIDHLIAAADAFAARAPQHDDMTLLVIHFHCAPAST